MANRHRVEENANTAELKSAARSLPGDNVQLHVDTSSPTWERLIDQINWYDRKSSEAQRWFKRLKLVELVAAASLPPFVGLGAPDWVAAVIASLIVVLEGCQHLFQWHDHWNNYRSTCESLRHEQYLFLARAGSYAAAESPTALLAERIEGLVSQEHAKWTAAQQSPGTRGDVVRPPS